MAYVNLNSPVFIASRGPLQDTTGATLDANGETVFALGYVYIPTGVNKTISAAGGGSIKWVSAASNVLANASTDVQLGIQDVAATGLPDGTNDVAGLISTATTTIANSTLFSTAMTSGTKTLSPGQLVAIGHTMVTRGGVDVVTVDRMLVPEFAGTSGGFGVPWGTANGTRGGSVPPYQIVFDDGTIGYILGCPLLYNMSAGPSVITFNVDSALDEYAGVIEFPVPVRLGGCGIIVGSVATTDPFEIIAYSSPFGVTPTALALWSGGASALVVDPDQFSGTAGVFWAAFETFYDLAANTAIGFSLRPTSTNNLTFSYFDLASSTFTSLKSAQPFSSIKMAARAGQSGAFAETQAYHLPDIAVFVTGFDNAVSSGGGETNYGFVA